MTRHDLEESAARLPHEPRICAVAEEGGRVVGWVTPIHDDLPRQPLRRR